MTGSDHVSNAGYRRTGVTTPPPTTSPHAAPAPPPPPSSVLYVTRDVLTQEAVVVWIVKREAVAELTDAFPTVLVVSEDDVDVTEGWRLRNSKAPLCVCFNYAFGKCSGKNNHDSATCFQIHIKRDVLARARAEHPAYHGKAQRLFFTRTVKAHLPPELRAAISLRLGRPLALHYLEFPAGDVQSTRALSDYERNYRAWLAADVATFPHGRVTPFNSPATVLCTHFCCTGACPAGAACVSVHASLAAAHVKEPALADVLADMARAPLATSSTTISAATAAAAVATKTPRDPQPPQRPRTVSLPPPWATPFAHAEARPTAPAVVTAAPPPAYAGFATAQLQRRPTPPPPPLPFGATLPQQSSAWVVAAAPAPAAAPSSVDADQRLRDDIARLLESPLVSTAPAEAFY